MALNLVQHRSGPSVWDSPDTIERDLERWLLAAAAGACVLAGARRGGLPGFLLAVGGAGLGWWATTGPVTRQARREYLKQVLPARHAADPVREASEDSFPASDAPAWTPTTGNL